MNRRQKISFLIFVTLAVLIQTAAHANAANNTTIDIGTFNTGSNVVYWSEETRNWFSGGSKLDIDQFAYVIDYNLGKGYIKIYTTRTEPITVVDVFSGVWKKLTIHRGENYIRFQNVSDYGGLRIVTIGSPLGIAILKERIDYFYFENYPLLILKKELANFGWQRAAGALGIFLVGFAISYWLKRYKLVISAFDNIVILAICVFFIASLLAADYHTTTITLNQQNTTIIKQIPVLELSKKQLKDMYNWAFIVFFMLGFAFAKLLADYEKIYIALVDYSKPIRLYALPYLQKRQLIRDFDGKLTELKFKDEFKQFVNFEIDKEPVKAILAVKVQDMLHKKTIKTTKMATVIAFLGVMAISLAGDIFNAFRIDLGFSVVFAVAVALMFNLDAVNQFFNLHIQKTKLIECSELMNEDNYTKMLKDAEIKHVAADYNKLLRSYIKEKVTAPRKVVKELLGVVREVKKTEEEEEKNDED